MNKFGNNTAFNLIDTVSLDLDQNLSTFGNLKMVITYLCWTRCTLNVC